MGDSTNSILNYATITAVSDVRLKTQILKIESVTEKLNKIYAYSYVMRKDPTQKKKIGFIAQELEEIFPELVEKSAPNGYLNVNYMGMVPILLQGLKESESRIHTLQSENELMKTKISDILARLEKLESESNNLLFNFLSDKSLSNQFNI